MFEALRNLVADLSRSGGACVFDDNDDRVAAAALLLHAAFIDGDMSDVERQRLHGRLKSRFALDDAAVDALIVQATAAEHEAVDLYRFTSLLNRSLDYNGRLRIVEMMWEVVYADGHVSELEDNLLWRVADLLGVSSHERIALRRRVAGQAGGGET